MFQNFGGRKNFLAFGTAELPNRFQAAFCDALIIEEKQNK